MDVTFSDGTIESYEDSALGAGAQGEIYRSKDSKHVVKVYYLDPTKENEHIKRIDTLINELNPTKDDPYWTSFFTWPEKRVVKPMVGYRMPFVDGLKTLETYYLGKSYMRLKPEERGWFIGRVACAIKLASAANRLATMGLCYPDFSGKNILVDPFEGRTVLIDCDSLTVPGKLPPTVEGTRVFRAPEIWMRQVTVPSVKTDRHALASILYHWLLLWDPLKGDKKHDPDPIRDDLLRYGERALYVEHPIDVSNHASKQYLKASMLGPELERLFRTAFVDGLHNPDRRPFPFQWRDALYHVYDQIIPCMSQHCDWRFFVALPHTARLTCPSCQTPLKQPPYLPFVYLLHHRGATNPDEYQTDTTRSHYVVGWPGRYLYQWHIRPDASAAYSDPDHIPDTTPHAVFEFDANSNTWYLKNLAEHQMYYRLSNDVVGMWRPWPVQGSIPLVQKMTLQFGPAPYHNRACVNLEKVG